MCELTLISDEARRGAVSGDPPFPEAQRHRPRSLDLWQVQGVPGHTALCVAGTAPSHSYQTPNSRTQALGRERGRCTRVLEASVRSDTALAHHGLNQVRVGREWQPRVGPAVAPRAPGRLPSPCAQDAPATVSGFTATSPWVSRLRCAQGSGTGRAEFQAMWPQSLCTGPSSGRRTQGGQRPRVPASSLRRTVR